MRLLNNTKKNDFVVIDSIFPQKEPFAFRNVEINEYLRRINNSAAYTMYPMQPQVDAWFNHSYGMTKRQFKDNLKGYKNYYPLNVKQIHYLDPKQKYRFKLAYSFFLAETYVLLTFYEKNQVPFIFVLYPGGAFGLNNKSSDRMLRRLFKSPLFKGVIVTQKITENYLKENMLCPPSKIRYIYGGFVQFKKEDVKQKKLYNTNKNTFDVCFVAAKYSKDGIDKGYDSFIKVAKVLAKDLSNIRFHVVGGFNEEDIDVSEISDKIFFYGYRKPKFLSKFYSSMDIALSPNRPYKLFKGNFDGFPLCIDASYCGVALFVADELKMNESYIEGKEIEIIRPDNINSIAKKVSYYYKNYELLYELSLNGQKKTQSLFDISNQINSRLKIFEQYGVEIRK